MSTPNTSKTPFTASNGYRVRTSPQGALLVSDTPESNHVGMTLTPAQTQATREYFQEATNPDTTPEPATNLGGFWDTLGELLRMAVIQVGEPESDERRTALRLAKEVEAITVARSYVVLSDSFATAPSNETWTNRALASLFAKFSAESLEHVLTLADLA